MNQKSQSVTYTKNNFDNGHCLIEFIGSLRNIDINAVSNISKVIYDTYLFQFSL